MLIDPTKLQDKEIAAIKAAIYEISTVVNGCHLWNLDTYEKRGATENSPGWNTTDNFIPPDTSADLVPPALTDKDEALVTFKVGDKIAIKKILFHTPNYGGKAYQCLQVITIVGNETKSGFLWSVYEGIEYIKLSQPAPKPAEPPELPERQPGDAEIEVHAGQTVVVEVKTEQRTPPEPPLVYPNTKVVVVLEDEQGQRKKVERSVIFILKDDPRTEFKVDIHDGVGGIDNIEDKAYTLIVDNNTDKSFEPHKTDTGTKALDISNMKYVRPGWVYRMVPSPGRKTFFLNNTPSYNNNWPNRQSKEYYRGVPDDPDAERGLPPVSAAAMYMGDLAPDSYFRIDQVLFFAQAVIQDNRKAPFLACKVSIPSVKNMERFIWPIYDDEPDNPNNIKAEILKTECTIQGNTIVKVAVLDTGVGLATKSAKTEQRKCSSVSQVENKKWILNGRKCTYPARSGNLAKFYADSYSGVNFREGYFADLLEAINNARWFIFISDWSFHPLFDLKPTDSDDENNPIGKLLADWCSKSDRRIVAIHTWNHTYLGAPDKQNDDGREIFENVIKVAPDIRGQRFFWRASSRTGIGWSHHQKFVVCDQPSGIDDRRVLCAFVGGIDLTKGRLDDNNHDIFPANRFFSRSRKRAGNMDYYYLVEDTNSEGETVKRPIEYFIDEWYNNEFSDSVDMPRQPWHDIHSRLIGPSAWDLVREFVGRWRLDEASFTLGHTDNTQVDNLFEQLFDRGTFYQENEGFVNKVNEATWSVQICRSIVRDHWGKDGNELAITVNNESKREFNWTMNPDYEMSVQDAYINAIKMAQRFVYIETQYFIGSGNDWIAEGMRRPSIANKIPLILCDKIVEMYRKGKDFHVYLLVPLFPEGNPKSAPNQAQRDFQWRSVETIIRNLSNEGIDWRKYLTVGFLANWVKNDGQPATEGNRLERVKNSQRYMIYVHSKLMIVDDEYLIVGSANLNERSLAGDRDTEICAGFWPDPNRETECQGKIIAFRESLWKEHFNYAKNGISLETPETTASLIQNIGKENYYNLINLRGGPNGHFCMLPFIDEKKEFLSLTKKYLMDAPEESIAFGLGRSDDWDIWPDDHIFNTIKDSSDLLGKVFPNIVGDVASRLTPDISKIPE